jgi:ATP-dependent Lhr-like helicase
LSQNVFEDVSQDLRRVLESQGITSPTRPQSEAIPVVRSGKNMLLVAPTGIGKTEAAMIPIMDAILRDRPGPICALYITPLRALNRDMLARLDEWGTELGISVAVRHGDTPQSVRQRLSKHPPEVLITTPETLQIMLLGKNLRQGLRNVRWVIVDEVHELASGDRGAQLTMALERMAEITESEFQRIGLSATVGDPAEVARFLGGVGRHVEIVDVQVPKGLDIRVEKPGTAKVPDNLRLAGVEEEIMGALARCRKLVEDHTSTLFFVNTRRTGEYISALFHLLDQDFKIGVHHGSLSKEVRIETEERFKAREIRALICTSSLELGIDVGHADFTIQYNSPRQATRLVQRIGRAGHGHDRVSIGSIIALEADDIVESCVLARRAMAGELEELVVRKDPMAVLANQIVAMSMEKRRTVREIRTLVARAYPFRDLAEAEFKRLMDQLVSLHLIWLDRETGTVSRKRKGFGYFYTNISMIPDERTYAVRDITTRKIVGVLDESFVISDIAPGTPFVVKGRPWITVELRESEILVEPTDASVDIPRWVGEEIPVPYEVAQEVGRLREKTDPSGYPVDEDSFQHFSDHVRSQEQAGAPVATHDSVVIESFPEGAIIHACFGSKVNETIGRLVSSLVSARVGSSVGIRTDPYRIVLELPVPMKGESVRELLLSIDPGQVEPILRIVLRNSQYIKWHLVHTARKFGAIERDVDPQRINIKRLVEVFADTPLFEETLDRVIWNTMDLERTEMILNRIRDGSISVATHKGLTPFGKAGLDRSRDFMSPLRADRQILLALKRRLENETVRQFCLNCDMSFRRKVADIPDTITCENCGGRMVAILGKWDREAHELLKTRRSRKGLSGNERKTLSRIKKIANLVLTHGRRAALVLAGRGIGHETAGRILRKIYDSEEELLKEILEAEIHYAKTKRFWD